MPLCILTFRQSWLPDDKEWRVFHRKVTIMPRDRSHYCLRIVLTSNNRSHDTESFSQARIVLTTRDRSQGHCWDCYENRVKKDAEENGALTLPDPRILHMTILGNFRSLGSEKMQF